MTGAATAHAQQTDPIVGRLWLRPPLAGVMDVHHSHSDYTNVDFANLTAGVEYESFVAELGGGALAGEQGLGPQVWIRGGVIAGTPASHWQLPLMIGYRYTQPSRNDEENREHIGSVAVDFGPQLTLGDGTGVRITMRILFGIAITFAHDETPGDQATRLLSAAFEIGVAAPVD